MPSTDTHHYRDQNPRSFVHITRVLLQAEHGLAFHALTTALDFPQTTTTLRSLRSYLWTLVRKGRLCWNHHLYYLPGQTPVVQGVTRAKGKPQKWRGRILDTLRAAPEGGLTRRQLFIRIGAVEAVASHAENQYKNLNGLLWRMQVEGDIQRDQHLFRLTPAEQR